MGDDAGAIGVERVADEGNLRAAWEKVRENDGAPGIDGVSVTDFGGRVDAEVLGLRDGLLRGSWRPSPLRRVDIPKPDGGVRMLGIPTVGDRVVHQAIAQVVGPAWEARFSGSSFGYRPGLGAHDALDHAVACLNEGFEVVLDLDIEKFFDRVDHGHLLERLVSSGVTAGLIEIVAGILGAGVLRDAALSPSTLGVPQGSPLSPLLANITLDELDQELGGRGVRFARYADDCMAFVRSAEEGAALLSQVEAFLAERLRLGLNKEKSRVVAPEEATYLGFSFRRGEGGWRPVVSREAKEAFRQRVAELAPLGREACFDEASRRVADYARGWMHYFGFRQWPPAMDNVMAIARRRLRAVIWDEWGSAKRRRRELMARRVPAMAAARAAASYGPGEAAANSPEMGAAMPNASFRELGLAMGGPESERRDEPAGGLRSAKTMAPQAPEPSRDAPAQATEVAGADRGMAARQEARGPWQRFPHRSFPVTVWVPAGAPCRVTLEVIPWDPGRCAAPGADGDGDGLRA